MGAIINDMAEGRGGLHGGAKTPLTTVGVASYSEEGGIQ